MSSVEDDQAGGADGEVAEERKSGAIGRPRRGALVDIWCVRQLAQPAAIFVDDDDVAEEVAEVVTVERAPVSLDHLDIADEHDQRRWRCRRSAVDS